MISLSLSLSPGLYYREPGETQGTGQLTANNVLEIMVELEKAQAGRYCMSM
jgi:hypothetical protein